jgi:EAL domain-containing protein (putative c-di-GMP-specific phosphodiesterase class I)
VPVFPVAVNVSPVQFRQPDFVDSVMRALENAGLDAHELELEISENLAMHSVNEVVRILTPLRERGVAIALDDFGTGYSSLAYLTQLPTDILKLDKSFVSRLGTDASSIAVANSILALARALHLKVIAEGIESPEALAHLQAQACERGQGYLFARPMPAGAFVEWCLREAAETSRT